VSATHSKELEAVLKLGPEPTAARLRPAVGLRNSARQIAAKRRPRNG
jgi:hypothetical protein